MSEYLNGIKAVLLDHDDTLVDTKGPKIRQHRFIASKYYGLEIDDETVLRNWGKPLSELVRIFYQTDDVNRANDLIREHYDEYRKELYPFTVPTLAAFRSLGLYIGIVTSTSRRNFDYDLTYLDIDPNLIDYSLTENETDFHKPDPRVFEPAIKWLGAVGVSPSETLYVGDGLQDGIAAIGAGFEFLGVQTGFIDEETFRVHGFTSVRDLGSIARI